MQVFYVRVFDSRGIEVRVEAESVDDANRIAKSTLSVAGELLATCERYLESLATKYGFQEILPGVPSECQTIRDLVAKAKGETK